MIVLFGFLSLLQIFFIPGLFVVKYSKLANPLINFLVIIAISPILNYLLVLLLTLFGIYNQIIMLIIFAIEIIFLLILYFPVLNMNFKRIFSSIKLKEFISDYFLPASNHNHWRKYFSKALLLFAFLFASYFLLFYLKKYGFQFNSVFTGWDPVFSWDRWAGAWYRGIFPKGTYHYPQLMPINYSLTYVFMGNEQVKFFAKMIANYLEIFVILAIFISGLITKKSGFFWGVIVASWLQLQLGSNGSGYVDTPVAFWGLLAFLFLNFSHLDKKNFSKYALFGAIFAAGSMVVKQAGGWIVITFSLFLINMVRKEDQRIWRPLLWKILLIYTIIIVPWYVYAQWCIAAGFNVSEIEYVTTLGSKGLTWIQTLQSSISKFVHELSDDTTTGSLLICSIFLFSLFAKENYWKRINFFIVIPFFLIWIFYFGYDTRNANLILPLLGIATGFGLQNLLIDTIYPAKFEEFVSVLIHNIYRAFVNLGKFVKYFTSKLKPIYFLPLIFLLLLLPTKYTNGYLIEKSINLQKRIGNPDVNAKLYEYFDKKDYEGKIVSDYIWISRLPEMNQYFSKLIPKSDLLIDQIENEDNTYLFAMPSSIPEEVNIYIETKVDENIIQPVFEIEGYYFYYLCHDICQ